MGIWYDDLLVSKNVSYGYIYTYYI